MRNSLTLVFVLAAASLAQAEVSGESDPAYRDAIRAALTAYDAGDLTNAHTQFEAAYARYPNARALRGLGTVELEQHNYVAATTHLEQALACEELPLRGSLRQETEAALNEANAHVGRVTVSPSPPTARVQLDDRIVASETPLVLEPGAYTLTLAAAGYRSESRQLTVVADQSQLVHWSLQPFVVEAPPVTVTPPAPTRESWKPWVVVSAGAAVTASGVAMLTVGLRDYQQLGGETSFADWQDRRDRYPVLTGIGGALIGAGGLAIASGLWWRSHARRDLTVSLGADRVLLRRQF